MRDIKFRVWNEFRIVEYEELREIAEKLHVDAGTYNQYENDILIPNSQELNVMQYTGLKDKDGIEIYEGDIIEHDRETRWEVVFKKGCFKIASIEHPISNLYLLGEANLENIEVIGNIYENKELLG